MALKGLKTWLHKEKWVATFLGTLLRVQFYPGHPVNL